jgi:hypothetical protein
MDEMLQADEYGTEQMVGAGIEQSSKNKSPDGNRQGFLFRLDKLFDPRKGNADSVWIRFARTRKAE